MARCNQTPQHNRRSSQTRTRICSDHFEGTDYQGDRLKPGAVPTVFPSFVEPLEMQGKKRPSMALASITDMSVMDEQTDGQMDGRTSLQNRYAREREKHVFGG
ncbi:hypothetical protein ANANG_G00090770 [Anguilla anguilla]|uniref:THAP-type domain-containing protein n=1 Tax=Anguilla anguilla TaxID=7936 RepID=A0A9D3MLS1_ANGAN|nr:hypothetical protein ANANG_G00090770 [Anguilla anguilla]